MCIFTEFLIDWSTDLCISLLSTLFKSYDEDSSHIRIFPFFFFGCCCCCFFFLFFFTSTRLGLCILLSKDTPMKIPEYTVRLEPGPSGYDLRVTHFTTEASRTLTQFDNGYVGKQPVAWEESRYSFWRMNNRQLLKTLCEKEKLLVTSNFSFSHNVFYPIR